jgi:hypothetical protein
VFEDGSNWNESLRGSERLVSKIPTDTQAIGGMAHEVTLGTNTLEKHDELQLAKHDGINRRATALRIALLHEATRHPRGLVADPDADTNDLAEPTPPGTY